MFAANQTLEAKLCTDYHKINSRLACFTSIINLASWCEYVIAFQSLRQLTYLAVEIKTLSSRQNCRHFADHNFTFNIFFVKVKCYISIQISLKSVQNGSPVANSSVASAYAGINLITINEILVYSSVKLSNSHDFFYVFPHWYLSHPVITPGLSVQQYINSVFRCSWLGWIRVYWLNRETDLHDKIYI